MAVSVVSFSQVADWFDNTTTHSVSGVSWSSGDVVVVYAAKENGITALNTPSNANLSFTLRASQTDGGSGEAPVYIWSAVAGSAQAAQTIQVTTTGTQTWGLAVWVLSGASGSFANATNNRTESTITFTPSAGSGVLYGYADWAAAAAGRTLATGTGIGTERIDTSNGTNYGVYVGDWMGVTAGSTAFGVTSYTGLQIGHLALEVLAASTGPAEAPGFFRVGFPGLNPDGRVYLPYPRSLNDTSSGVAVDLAGSIPAASGQTADVTVGFALSGHADLTSQHTGLVGLVLPHAGHVDAASGITGASGLALPLAGHTDAASQETGNLGQNFAVSGHLDAASQESGTLGQNFAVSGHVDAASQESGTLTATFSLAGHLDAASQETGSLVVTYSLTGHIDGTSGLTGGIAGSVPLDGTIPTSSQETGVLGLGLPLAGHSDVASASTGLLGLPVTMSGHIDATTLEIGDLTTSSFVTLAGHVDAAALVIGTPTVSITCTGTIPTTTGLTNAELRLMVPLGGLSPGTLDASGTLRVVVPLAGGAGLVFVPLEIVPGQQIEITGIVNLRRRYRMR